MFLTKIMVNRVYKNILLIFLFTLRMSCFVLFNAIFTLFLFQNKRQ